MTYDARTVAIVLATGAAAWAVVTVAAAVAVVTARTIGHHHRQRNATRSTRSES